MNTIQMTRLGRSGQWGNQVFQYAYIRTCARRYNCGYELPVWGGQYLFGHQDPPLTRKRPQIQEHFGETKHERCFGIPTPLERDEVLNHDFVGWCQYHTSWYAPDKPFIHSLFRPVGPERTRVHNALLNLRSRGNAVVTLHLRRSDAGRMIFFLTPVTWYLRWLREHWKRLDRPVLYIATEDTKLLQYFKHYNPVTMEDLGLPPQAAPPGYTYPYGQRYNELRQLDFFPDWYIMQNSDILVASDSTFSFSAAWTSEWISEYWRSRLSSQTFEPVDPWNAHVSWREHLNDYPGIPGTQMDANPIYGDYWRNYTAKHPSVPIDPKEIEELMTPCL